MCICKCTYPKFMFVSEPETEILGGSDLFIYAGSTINLTCIVRHTPEPPNTINWTHRGKVIINSCFHYFVENAQNNSVIFLMVWLKLKSAGNTAQLQTFWAKFT